MISALYGDRILLLDARRFNLGENYYLSCRMRPFEQEEPMNLDWVRRHTVCIHYCGRNKPWKPHYKGGAGRVLSRVYSLFGPSQAPAKPAGEIRLKKVCAEEKEILHNLLEKYMYEFSQYHQIPFGPDGLYHWTAIGPRKAGTPILSSPAHNWRDSP